MYQLQKVDTKNIIGVRCGLTALQSLKTDFTHRNSTFAPCLFSEKMYLCPKN